MREATVTDKSSSNRGPGACDAIVSINNQQVGVIRLPENRANDFIDQFNRTYAEMGMALEPIPGAVEEPADEQTKNPRRL